MPQEVQGSQFGNQLRALVHHLYALGMTEPGIFEFLRAFGIEISEGQIHNILMSESAGYQRTSEAILTVGIEEKFLISVLMIREPSINIRIATARI